MPSVRVIPQMHRFANRVTPLCSRRRHDAHHHRRKTGKRRIAVPSAGTWIVVGSNFAQENHPAWTSNLIAHPECEILVRGTSTPAIAELLDGDDRAVAWQEALNHFGGWRAYTDITDREFRIFRITPTDVIR